QASPSAPAHGPKQLWVNEVALAQSPIQPCHHIDEVSTAPIPMHGTGKRLTVALAPAWVGVDHGVSGAGIDLELVEEVIAILCMRPTVEVEQRWIALSWGIAVGLHDPAVECQASPLIAPAFWPGERD